MPQFNDVSSKFGAPMGRREYGNHGDVEGPIEVFRVRLVDGDYDDGGAYWGSGAPLYCARGEGYRAFARGKNLEDALNTFGLTLEQVTVLPPELDATYLEAFLQAYIECALWSSTDDSDTPLDENYGPEDIEPATLLVMRGDCEDFLKSMWPIDSEFWTAEQAGHDFWLTRNRHGAGFWDRYSYGPDDLEGGRLSEAARLCGSVYLYVGDDGKVCGESG